MANGPSGDDGFKWFGEGFDGFPKRLPEDCVEYVIYAIDEHLQDIARLRIKLREILKTAESLKERHLKQYIWQRDEFALKIYPEPLVKLETSTPSLPSRPHLRGRTNFGDSIADEWLIVYLLLEISKVHREAWIRVFDTDGEFLLIEAAGALPKWLNPDIAENRVWINNGHLRIIPVGENVASRNLSLAEALAVIQTRADSLIISPFIEDEAFYRIRDYPAAIPSSLHHTLVTIPRRLAFLLKRNPAYISPAIEAFYVRDKISIEPLNSKDLATLFIAPEDFVSTSIAFTKVGYAQLKSQIFDAPPSWSGFVTRLRDTRAEVGMKVACGMEMLLHDPQKQDGRAVREMKLLLEDVEAGEERLPTDEEMAQWSQVEDDEKWLEIDYKDFEKELDGKGRRDEEANGDTRGMKGEGLGSAQENVRKMVSRFEDFLNDDRAGIDGIGSESDELGSDDEGESNGSGTDSDEVDDEEGEDKHASFDETEFERAMKEMMGMPAEEIEKSGLLDEARRLANEDAEEDDEPHDEDEEMKKVIEMMERELKGHGALNLKERRGGRQQETSTKSSNDDGVKPAAVFGPGLPPSMKKALVKGKSRAVSFADGIDDDDEEADEEIGPGDGELSSDDEDFNDIDTELVKNMLEAFKSQAGMAGPAGNMMRAMGINMPRDEDDRIK